MAFIFGGRREADPLGYYRYCCSVNDTIIYIKYLKIFHGWVKWHLTSCLPKCRVVYYLHFCCFFFFYCFLDQMSFCLWASTDIEFFCRIEFLYRQILESICSISTLRETGELWPTECQAYSAEQDGKQRRYTFTYSSCPTAH